MVGHPSPGWFIFLRSLIESSPSDSGGGAHSKLSYAADGVLTTPFPRPSLPSLRKSILLFDGENGQLWQTNNYEIFTEESYLQFLLNIKLPPLQKEDYLIYKP